MARIKINLPQNFVFKTQIRTQIGDVNYGGHMGNDAYLKLAHEARIQFLESNNWSEIDVDGHGLIMSDAAIQFMGEVFRGDELMVEIAVDEVSKRGFDLYYTFTRIGDNKLIAKIKTGMLLFDYSTKRLATASEQTINKLTDLAGQDVHN